MRSSISRRDACKAVIAATTALANTAHGADMPPLYPGDIIDTHLHLWDLDRLRPPWIATSTGRAKEVLAHDHLLSDYATASRGLKIKQAVYMEVDVAEDDEVKEAKYVTELINEAKSPMVAAVISGRPASAGFTAYLDQFRENKAIKGVRQVLHTPATPPRFCLEPAFVKGVQILGDRGLSFDLCLRNDQLEEGAALVEKCPGTRFILDHCGNPQAGSLDLEGWKKGLARLAKAGDSKVMCKVSGLYANVTVQDWPPIRLASIVRTVIDLFGWDRLMFAGDWPVVDLGASFKAWTEGLKEIVRQDSPENQAKLFYGNARKFYGLA